MSSALTNGTLGEITKEMVKKAGCPVCGGDIVEVCIGTNHKPLHWNFHCDHCKAKVEVKGKAND